MKTTWKTWALAMMAAAAMIPLGCSGSAVEVGSQPPSCPSAEPKAGAACSVTASSCTYAEGPCTVELSCDTKIGAWQSQTTSCLPEAKECWMANHGDICAVVGETCAKPSGPCGGDGLSNACGEDHHWHFSNGGYSDGENCCPHDGACPASLPSAGSLCDKCFGPPSCSYPSVCGGDYATKASCESGITPEGLWHISIGDCPPPPPPDFCTNLGTQGACEMDAGCRWLTPGCGDTPILGAGCHTINDCGPGTCGPTEICQEFSYNPCFNKGCDACGAPASLCVWGL